MMNIKRLVTLFVVLFCVASFASVNGQESSDELKGRLKKHVYKLSEGSIQERKAGETSSKAAEYIASELQKIGVAPFDEADYFQNFVIAQDDSNKEIKGTNVIGVIHSPDQIMNDEYIVIGAGYNLTGPKESRGKLELNYGADEASGAAALIEVARMLKENESELKRSVLFVAFDAEKVGRLGSTYFVENSVVPIHNIFLMIDINRVGELDESGVLSYYKSGRAAAADDLFLAFLLPDDYQLKTHRVDNIIYPGESAAPFIKKWIPTISATAKKHVPFQRSEEDPGKLDYQGMEYIVYNIGDVALKTSTISDFPHSEEYSLSDGELTSKDRAKRKRRDNPVFTFGINLKGGANKHKFTSGPTDGKSKAYFSAGLIANTRLTKSGMLGLRTGVSYQRAGAKHIDGAVWTNAITVPLELILSTPSSFPLGVELSVGGFYNHHFSGKQGGKSIDFHNTFYRNEGGMSWGLGVRFSRYTIAYQARYGISNFTRQADPVHGDIRNHNSLFSFTYTF